MTKNIIVSAIVAFIVSAGTICIMKNLCGGCSNGEKTCVVASKGCAKDKGKACCKAKKECKKKESTCKVGGMKACFGVAERAVFEEKLSDEEKKTIAEVRETLKKAHEEFGNDKEAIMEKYAAELESIKAIIEAHEEDFEQMHAEKKEMKQLHFVLGGHADKKACCKRKAACKPGCAKACCAGKSKDSGDEEDDDHGHGH